ncbi:chemotaxis protein CheW [Geminocystis sp. NIES-3709]|uniref:chemotaxis protein CheW n=1 Tax=Geminocystis sp. NIES-3709 TaxID=1617448 RepID=UPI0005FCBFB1|nr:chemotaxis protein CheW [Geminocystis sp. NIES-3709]BAQ66748.1 hypothetical protein GM3709_3513 [Geminocystis sp. NIES-3709]
MSISSPFTRLQELLPQLFQEPELKGTPYLRFSINNGQQSALIPMKNVKESLSVSSEKITPIPSLPSFVMGLMSSRDSVFLAIDLGQFIGLSPLSSYLRQYNVMVLDLSSEIETFESSFNNLLIGFAVSGIQGINRLMPEQIVEGKSIPQEFPPVTTDLPEMTKQYFSSSVKGKERELMILDLPKISSVLGAKTAF